MSANAAVRQISHLARSSLEDRLISRLRPSRLHGPHHAAQARTGGARLNLTDEKFADWT
jgi:hypothetical protein